VNSSVEAEGNSIDEAIDLALRRLGVTRDKVEIEILSNATRGLFGFGGRRARVRASVRTTFAGESPNTPWAPVAEAESVAPPPVRPVARPRRTEEPVSAPDSRTLESARALLQEIVMLIGSEARVEIRETAEGAGLAIAGDETGILIGRRGQTLDALEYVVNRMVARDDGQAARISIDSQNYRARRREALTALAHRLAEQARRRGKPVTLNPMSPRDRRIVHLALQDTPALTTRSLGTGYFRKLVIVPEGRGRGPRRPTERRSG